MKNIIKFFLKKCGYNIIKRSKYYDILEEIKIKKKIFTFVQVGANDGIRFDNLYFFVTSKNCSGLVIEPMMDYYERLVFNYKDYPKIKPIRKALHPTLDKSILHRVDPKISHELPHWVAGIASFLPKHHTLTKIPSEYMIEEEVPCISFMKLIEQENIKELDLVQIDTEGFDAEIIKMIDFSLITPKVIKYEHIHLLNEERERTELELRSQGYRILKRVMTQ